MACIIMPYYNADFHTHVDVLLNGEEVWFKISDISKVLGYVDNDPIRSRYRDNIRIFSSSDVPGGYLRVPKASFISANDLLAFLLFSRKPNAYQLRKWLVDEVLPSIDTYIADANSREDSLLYAMNKFRQVRKVRQAQQDDMIKDAMRVIAVWIEQAPKSHVQMLHDALVGSEPK